MNTMTLRTTDGRVAFEPGEEIEVAAEWELADPPEALELRLGWKTKGRGDADEEIVDRKILMPSAAGSENWRLLLPESPYSFSGKLVSLVWWIELASSPKGRSERLEITLAPTAQEILLHPPA